MARYARAGYFRRMIYDQSFLKLPQMGWIVCVGLLLAVTGCESDGGYASSGYRGRSSTQVAAYQDDYDYYPGYETYYSRNRHEYVYRDGNSWVRRSQPRGVTVDALRTAPTVRMNFHDAPEQHHTETIKTYPHNWRDTNHDGKIDEKDRRDQRDNDRR
ncbi:MAG: hypothetical protein JWQ62_1447 [Lacunisphaera sp.]|nr:hypothetical protein [Lacunisphaera sp.]